VFALTAIPASWRSRIAAIAAANDPRTPRCSSCVAARPSTETLALTRPTAAARALGRHAAAAGRQERLHAARRDVRDQLAPVGAQVALAADQHDLDDAELRELIDQIERLRGGQLVGARPAGPRPAVAAREITCERDLPHGEDRAGGAVERADLVGERQVAAGGRRLGSQRQALMPNSSPHGSASVHWIR
jgi:hypothetical protein